MMPRRTSRRVTNYSEQNNEQQANKQQNQQQSNAGQQPQSQNSAGYGNQANDNDSVIADMAQGFIQAQAAMADKSMGFNNLEIGLLLQKVNDQLEEIKRSTPNSTPISGQNSKNSTGQDSGQQNGAGGMTTQADSKQQADSGATTELQALLTSVLQGKNNNENSESKSSPAQNNSASSSKVGKNSQNIKPVQTVSQVLAQAQYELANELETSLKKLKQVISDSEKLANDISNLLGEETMKKS